MEIFRSPTLYSFYRTEGRYLLAGAGSNDEGLDFVEFAAPVGEFDFVTCAHDDHIAQVDIAKKGWQTFRSNFWLIGKWNQSSVVIAQEIGSLGLLLPVHILV